MRTLKAAMAALTTLGIAASAAAAPATDNPFLSPYDTPFNIPPFEQIKLEHYVPALKAGIDEQRAQIEAIVNNPETPTFANTILALEQSGKTLEKVVMVFFSLNESMSTPEMEAVADELMPLYSQWADEVAMNPQLFARIRSLHERLPELNLPVNERRAVEKAYEDAVRGGALLSDEQKAELSALNTELTGLYMQFNRNLLNATNAFEAVVTDPAQLSGLPANVVEVAAQEAKQRGKADGTWVFTLHAPSRLPVLQFADSPDLRRQVYRGYTTLASSGEYDNRPVIAKILKARTAKARLLGYDNFAAYMTANVMGKTPERATDLLMQIFEPAKGRVKDELKEMEAISGFPIQPWDYYYYAEKVRKQKYDLDEDVVKAYFPAESVRQGIFSMANKLYGLTFTEIPDAPKYHPDVTVYEVKDAAGDHLAVFMTDYYSRPSKRQGAWMDAMQISYVDPDGTSARPIIYNVANFAKPTGNAPSLLSIDDVETSFHEFGHALHGMLTRAKLRSQSGTSVDRDIVELPSQIHEHWAFQPGLIEEYARHYQTGEVLPDSLVAKIEAAGNHNMGFMTTELVGAALLDLAWGQVNVDDENVVDVDAFEAAVKRSLGMPEQIEFRYRSPYFKHIFGSDGYASGYYTYLWAETLDRDAFDLFEQNGVWDKATADSFRTNLLEPGGSEDPMVLYKRFRGHEPSVMPLLRGRGLDGYVVEE